MKKALYREYRPKTFDEVLDQEKITSVLRNQVMHRQVGHAYLFSGTRGTGKTSCAKIFSRAVNCLHPVDGNPCNECENCRAILEERTMDVVEMDAASNRRIDDIRELRDKVVYPPAKLRYKVYIIDEAHMITNEGFNALLKIMEEPPAHLLFILATTELEKIPATILSRTQRYEFTRIGLPALEANLQRIAKEEGVGMDEEAAHRLGMAANGAMRDALSLLDQVLALQAPRITSEVVDRVLGTVGTEVVHRLWQAIFADDLGCAFQVLEGCLQEGKEPGLLLKEMIACLRSLLLAKAEALPAEQKERRGALQALAEQASLQRLLDSTEILLRMEETARRSDQVGLLLEAGVARLVDYQNREDLQSRVAALEDKLSAIQRWQVPEAVIRDEVRKWQKDASAAGKPLPQEAHIPPSPDAKEAGSDNCEPGEAAPMMPSTQAPDAVASADAREATEPKTSAQAVDHEGSEAPPLEEAASPAFDAGEFTQNPQTWFEAHWPALLSEIQEATGLIPPFFEKAKQLRITPTHLQIIYAADDQMFVNIVGAQQQELSDLLSRATGVSLVVQVVSEEAVEEVPPKEKDQVLAKLQALIPDDLLEIDPTE